MHSKSGLSKNSVKAVKRELNRKIMDLSPRARYWATWFRNTEDVLQGATSNKNPLKL